jgi:hypothetical protein
MKLPLRTLFVLIALISIPMGWMAYQLNWIRQRHAFLNKPPMPAYSTLPKSAPWPLELFGELGISQITVAASAMDDAHSLFPEADVSDVGK